MARLAAFGMAMVVAVGPFTVLLLLLNRRDRREETLLGFVAVALPAGARRSDVGIRVHCPVLFGPDRVRLYVGPVATEAGRALVTAVRDALPADVELRVDEPVARSPRPVTCRALSAGWQARESSR